MPRTMNAPNRSDGHGDDKMSTLQPTAAARPTIPDVAAAPRFLGEGRIGSWERTVPRPGSGELLLAVRANAICGSERGQYVNGSDVVPGHETAGIVVATGEGTKTPVGTAGVVFLMDFCGTCRSCAAGATNECLAKRADMGFTHDGGYGPYELVHETNFFPVPPDVALAEATLLLDVMGTTGHALERARLVTPDIRAIAVSGAGPLGLGLVVMARLLLEGSVPVVVADVQPARLDLVARLGVLVCVGHGEALELAVSPDLIAPERAILGSEYFRFDELPRNLDLLRSHRNELAPIISARYPIAELRTAFELFMSGTTGKVVVEQ